MDIKITPKIEPKKTPIGIMNNKPSIKVKFHNFKLKIKNMSHSNLFKSIKELLFYAIIYGALINYSLSIFGIKFSYRFPAYGIFLYLIKSEVVALWREFWFRNEK